MYRCSQRRFFLQGDFPHGLVKNPPKTLWARQLKVSDLIVTGTHSGRTVTPSSSQAYQTLPHFTNVAFGYAQAAASVLWDLKQRDDRPDTTKLLKETLLLGS
jgi:hypothetical protein